MSRWLKAEGDPVAEGEVLLEVQPDKAGMDVESDLAGVVLEIRVPEDEMVPCGTPLCWIGEAGESEPEP